MRTPRIIWFISIWNQWVIQGKPRIISVFSIWNLWEIQRTPRKSHFILIGNHEDTKDNLSFFHLKPVGNSEDTKHNPFYSHWKPRIFFLTLWINHNKYLGNHEAPQKDMMSHAVGIHLIFPGVHTTVQLHLNKNQKFSLINPKILLQSYQATF